jgi:DNA mismatch repair protein MutS
MSIVKDYLSYTLEWKKEYGEKTIVLIQVGSFFEVYALKDLESGKITGSNIIEFANLNDLVVSPKQSFIDKKQVMMAGFGLPQIDKYVRKLQENGYTIVIYKQDIQGKNTTRSVYEIVSPGTFFSSNDESSIKLTNNTMCIWIHTSVASKYFNNKSTKKMMTIGISNIDIYTGKTSLFQFELDYSFHNPITYDELERYVSIYNPNECIIISNIEEEKDNLILNDIISFIGFDNCPKLHKVNVNTKTETKMSLHAKNAEKQIYQQEILKRFYPKENQDLFSTSLMTYFIATQSFCFLLDFIYQHSPNLINNLSAPVFETQKNKLVLANHSLKQLNIIDDERHTGKLRSVSSFLNNCVTIMGKRTFMYNLHNPTTNIAVLNSSYEITSHLLKNEIVNWELELRSKLNGIRDLEKLIRKLVLSKITPKDFALLVQDLKTIRRLYETTEKDKILCKYIQAEQKHGEQEQGEQEQGDIKTYCNNIINELEKVFDIEKCAQMNTIEIDFDDNNNNNSDSSLFINPCVNKSIDELMKANVDSREKIEAIRAYLSNLVKGVEKGSTANQISTSTSLQFIKIHETPKSLPVLLGTSKRVATLKSQLKKNNIKEIKLTYISKYTKKEEAFDFNISSLTFDTTIGSNKKDLVITNDLIKKITEEMQSAKDKLMKEIVLFYNNYVKNEFMKYEMQMNSIVHYTTLLDILQCKCYIAYKYNYCKPIIDYEEKKSYLSFKSIRHPLIEHLQTNELYVTNDLEIGVNNTDGLLLYGTNAVGKTSFIKSVGIALIMAQTGLFVPCESFKYKPYSCIFTRILGNDNIFKGLSTFAVEMSELRTILTQADENSLVLGDELCSGTENESALSIFTAGLELLHKRKSTFLFATHFHEIAKYNEIKSLDKLKMMHMAVVYNKETGKLVYDRRLKEGSGESMYGLEVCKSLSLPDDFLQRAHDIRMRYNPECRNILALETSQYNAKKIVGGLCELCIMSKANEVHHLQPQKKARKDKNDYIGTFHKNHLANLVNICEDCHQKIHLIGNKEHKIIKTSNGYEMISI